MSPLVVALLLRRSPLPQTCRTCSATASVIAIGAGSLAVGREGQSKLEEDRTVLDMRSRVLVRHTTVRAGRGRGQAST